jgi:predicted HNH restriction endonuclease
MTNSFPIPDSPKNLSEKAVISQNIMIVCANCHRRLHYARVEVTVLTPATLEITINGTSYEVRRNVL